ncbi:hypothetical protein HMPREF1401_00385 [Helicobacter pylori GAM120Ai]|uniref:Uncharacterized protein n=1 Tax=Helicobacter pylori GAM120Ai TaxID=1159029 RepID=A0AAV3IGI8_HELPX|nr:hypothetical protein HMPREF1401_00385 [Helicobacter pylori GAM120Ai]
MISKVLHPRLLPFCVCVYTILALKSLIKRIFVLIFSWCLLFLDLIFQIFYRLV